MAENRFWKLSVITSSVALVGLLVVPAVTSMSWATSPDTPRMMNKKPTMRAPATTTTTMSSPQMMTTQTPSTLDSYIDYVSDRLQVEAMKVRQPGTADIKLTIERDGTVRLAEVVRVDGPAALRDAAIETVRLVGSLPPLPPDANADVLVLTSTVVFNYPGQDLYDHLSERTSRRR
jgi:TonB family protein